MHLKIPTQFKLAGLTINVEQDNDLVKTKQVIGFADYSKQRIVIDTTAAPLETTEQSFIHELIHWAFYVLGEEKLRNNEKLVDTLAHLLYQAIKTSEGRLIE